MPPSPTLRIHQIVLGVIIFVYLIYGLYFHYDASGKPDYWPIRFGLIGIAVILLTLSFLSRRVGRSFATLLSLLTFCGVIQGHLNMLLYGIDYSTHFRSIIIAIGASFFFRRRLHFLIYMPIYLLLGFLVLSFSPHNALGLKNFLFMEVTSLVIQAIFVIYILSKEDRLRAIYQQKQVEIQKAQSTLFALLPDAVKPIRGLEVGGFFSPSEDLGGDFLDLKSCRHGLLVIMADCSGHGIGASLNAVLLKTVCDRHLPELEKNGKPEIFLSRLNRDIAEYNQGGQYHALLAGVVDTVNGELRYANAGAKAPVLIRGKTSERLPVPQGFLLGYEKEVRYESARIPLQNGDRIFFHSDALTEIISPKTGLSIFGDKQLEVRLAAYPFEDPLKDLRGIQELVIRENRGRALRDDLTMVLVEFSRKRAGKPKAPTLFIDKSFSLKENFT